MSQHLLRQLPKVSVVLDHELLKSARAQYPANLLTETVREILEQVRTAIQSGAGEIPTLDSIAQQSLSKINHVMALKFRTVINATGIVLHTNLGRSPMPEEAALAAYEAARGYLNLELDLSTGLRSSRQNPIREGICQITGAEAATAVNNCAAATIIVLRTLAMGKEVIVSRGQLVEIGGSFRIPDILTVSGATLKEVGTTNITRLSDYERAIGPNTGLLMRIHTSNYRVSGFTESVGIAELAELGKKHNIPVVDDVGSGAVLDFSKYGLFSEPLVGEGIRSGADLVLFSGDKLLGGPQSGLIAGRKELIQRIEKDPLMRAFRLDKMALAALEATLRYHRDAERVTENIPTLKMLTIPLEQLRERASTFAEKLRSVNGLSLVQLREDIAYVGGGSLPDEAIPTIVIALKADQYGEDTFAERLRLGTPAVMGRIQAGSLLIDLRTVFPRQEEQLLEAIRHAVQ
jgi:L-seryl-tRNA(Ser) seleniumtransferase